MGYSQNPYLRKYAWKEVGIKVDPHPNLQLIVVIPCFNEAFLLESLNAIHRCERPPVAVEVIVVINSSENSLDTIKEQNLVSYHEALEWSNRIDEPNFKIHIILEQDLPDKIAGVGLARKIGMDEAVYRFHQLNRGNGVIVCFDADALCDTNYLTALERHFAIHPETDGCSIYFEHPISGDAYDEKVYQGITLYELFLRYYRQGLQYANHPFAFHTIGSSMAVRSSTYQQQGGMNKRKAGEDFYFLQKVIAQRKFSELNTTCVIPSPRPSDRVPFGTGKAIGDWLEGNKDPHLTYAVQTFEDLKAFVSLIPDLYYQKKIPVERLAESMQAFLKHVNADQQLDRIRNNAASNQVFSRHVFDWFNAFMALKYCHFARDNGHYKEQPIISESNQLLEYIGKQQVEPEARTLLKTYRELDKAMPTFQETTNK